MIAGPGDLVVQAGRNFYGGAQSDLHSIGPLYGIEAESRNSGANITVLAGVGADGRTIPPSPRSTSTPPIRPTRPRRSLASLARWSTSIAPSC